MQRDIRILSTVIALAFITTGCAHKSMMGPPPPPPPETILGTCENDSLKNSLFKGDQNVLSDQDIARILGTQLKLSDRHRLAILSLSHYSPWSEDIADIETKNFDSLMRTLKSSSQQLTRSGCCHRCWCRKSERCLI